MLRTALEHRLHAGRRIASPVGADHQIVARVAAGRARADIAVVVGAAVDQLDRVVALRVDRRHADHQGLRPEVHPQHRIGGIAIGRDDRGVLVGEHLVGVGDGVERRLVLAGILVDHELVQNCVVHHDRQAVGEAVLRDVDRGEEAGTGVLRERRAGQGGSERAGGAEAKEIAFRQHGKPPRPEMSSGRQARRDARGNVSFPGGRASRAPWRRDAAAPGWIARASSGDTPPVQFDLPVEFDPVQRLALPGRRDAATPTDDDLDRDPRPNARSPCRTPETGFCRPSRPRRCWGPRRRLRRYSPAGRP